MDKPQPDPEDGLALFEEEMGEVEPLKHDRQEPFRERRRPMPLPPNPTVTGDELDEEFVDTSIETGDELLFMRPGVQNRLFQDLRRGHIKPDDLLDLHGLRVVEARTVLSRFLAHARRNRLRVVHIIHGKGYGSQSQQPILKQKLNQWLRQRDDVLAFCSAPRFDGGTGAAYVLLSLKNAPDRDHPWRR
jgi:DNA-nicking Smr family endonuclease